MLVRKLRLSRGWSQDQLAELTGLSVRTIQRIERGHNAGLESLNALAAVFEIDLKELQSEASEPMQSNISLEEERAIRQVRDIKAFYIHLACYLITVPVLVAANLYWTPERIWVIWTACGWGLGVLSHGLTVFEVIRLFSPDWERRQIEKRLGRKL